MSTYLEELAALVDQIGDEDAQTVLMMGWIGPQEVEALVDAAQQARKQLAKARADLEQHLMTANMPNIGGAM